MGENEMKADVMRLANWPLYLEVALEPGIRDRVFGPTTRGAGGCIERSRPYAQIYVKGRYLLVHRVAYLIERGPFDPSSDLDHLCRNPKCINPDHLEPVSHTENVQRGASATRTTGPCKRGHNDWVKYKSSQGRGVCRTCNVELKRARRLKARAEGRKYSLEPHHGEASTPADRLTGTASPISASGVRTRRLANVWVGLGHPAWAREMRFDSAKPTLSTPL